MSSFFMHLSEKAEKMWKTLSLTVVPVALGLGFLNVYLNGDEGDPPEFIPYEHLRIRTKVKFYYKNNVNKKLIW